VWGRTRIGKPIDLQYLSAVSVFPWCRDQIRQEAVPPGIIHCTGLPNWAMSVRGARDHPKNPFGIPCDSETPSCIPSWEHREKVNTAVPNPIRNSIKISTSKHSPPFLSRSSLSPPLTNPPGSQHTHQSPNPSPHTSEPSSSSTPSSPTTSPP
jgi:hypothetical protein